MNIMNKEEILIKLICEWINTNDKLRKINKYLYDHTDLFERTYEKDYNNDLYHFFASKITKFSRDEHKLLSLLTSKQLYKLEIEDIIK